MVRDGVDRSLGALQVVTPRSEHLEDGEELLIVRVIVELRGSQSPRLKRNGTDFPVGAFRRQDPCDGLVRRVCFDDECGIQNAMREDGHCGKCLF